LKQPVEAGDSIDGRGFGDRFVALYRNHLLPTGKPLGKYGWRSRARGIIELITDDLGFVTNPVNLALLSDNLDLEHLSDSDEKDPHSIEIMDAHRKKIVAINAPKFAHLYANHWSVSGCVEEARPIIVDHRKHQFIIMDEEVDDDADIEVSTAKLLSSKKVTRNGMRFTQLFNEHFERTAANAKHPPKAKIFSFVLSRTRTTVAMGEMGEMMDESKAVLNVPVDFGSPSARNQPSGLKFQYLLEFHRKVAALDKGPGGLGLWKEVFRVSKDLRNRKSKKTDVDSASKKIDIVRKEDKVIQPVVSGSASRVRRVLGCPVPQDNAGEKHLVDLCDDTSNDDMDVKALMSRLDKHALRLIGLAARRWRARYTAPALERWFLHVSYLKKIREEIEDQVFSLRSFS